MINKCFKLAWASVRALPDTLPIAIAVSLLGFWSVLFSGFGARLRWLRWWRQFLVLRKALFCLRPLLDFLAFPVAQGDAR